MRTSKTTRNTLLAAGMAGLALTGAAHAQEKSFDLSGFTGVDIATGIDARVTLSEDFSIRAQSRSTDALDKLELSVRDGILVARIESNFLDFILSGGLVGMLLSGGNAVSLDITLPALDSAVASSGADIKLTAITADSLALEASSGADISARLSEQVRARASSGGDIEIQGNPQQRDIDTSSGGDVHFED